MATINNLFTLGIYFNQLGYINSLDFQVKVFQDMPFISAYLNQHKIAVGHAFQGGSHSQQHYIQHGDL